jgi:hypothetical protein
LQVDLSDVSAEEKELNMAASSETKGAGFKRVPRIVVGILLFVFGIVAVCLLASVFAHTGPWGTACPMSW